MKNLYLDLDETCIYSFYVKKQTWQERNHKLITHYKGFLKFYDYDEFVIFERPGLQEFVDWAFENFKVSVWSAGCKEYVDFISKNIIQKDKRLHHCFCADDCDKSTDKYGMLKKLELLYKDYKLPGHHADNIILVDDLLDNAKSQESKVISVPAFDLNSKKYADMDPKKLIEQEHKMFSQLKLKLKEKKKEKSVKKNKKSLAKKITK